MALDATVPGERVEVRGGWEAVFTYLRSDLGGLYQNVANEARFIVPGVFYAEWDTFTL